MKNPAKLSGDIHKDKFLFRNDNTKISNLPDTSAAFLSEKDKKILSYLKDLPSLEFSIKGLENIINRFRITADQLAFLIDLINTKAK